MARDWNGSGNRARRTRRGAYPLIFLSFAACGRILGIGDLPSGGSGSGHGAKPSELPAGAAGAGGRTGGDEPGGRSAVAGAGESGAGEGGAGAGGVSGTGGRGTAGVTGNAEGGAGEGGAGTSTGGNASAGTSNGGSAGGGASGGRCVENALDEGLLEATKRLGARCSDDEKNQMACSDSSASLILQCRNGLWAEAITCESTYTRCLRTAGQCSGVDPACTSHIVEGPFCDGGDAIDCDSHLYRQSRYHCQYGCEAGACLPGGAGDLTLHLGEGMVFSELWQKPIPVCVRGGNEDLVALVREEVETTWSRYFSVAFTGFGPCQEEDDETDESAGGLGGAAGAGDQEGDEGKGLVLSFVDGCSGELVNNVNTGRPKDGHAISVQICKSYCDSAANAPSDVPPNVLRMLARHQFGHVLGRYWDGVDPRETMMVRSVRLADVDKLVMQRQDYISTSYPFKHALSLVTPRGNCVTASDTAAGAEIRADFCPQYGDRRDSWALYQGHIQAYELDTTCIEPSPQIEGGLELATCSPATEADGFRMAHGQWRTPLDCVGVDTIESGAVLRTEACETLGTVTQAWNFDVGTIYSGYSVAQIRLGDSGYCASVPRPERIDTDVLELRPCTEQVGLDDPQTFFLVVGGTIKTRGKDGNGTFFSSVDWKDPEGALYLSRGSRVPSWTLSGVVEYGADQALTEDAGNLVLTKLDWRSVPSSQIFDLHF